MKLLTNLSYVAACGVAMLGLSVSANADTGYAWIVSDTQAQTATSLQLANLGLTTSNPDVKFNITGGLGTVNFNSNNTGYTFGQFLSSPGTGASGVTYPDAGPQSVNFFLAPAFPDSTTPLGGTNTTSNGSGALNNPYGSLFELTGNVTAGETINVTHDDGASLYINGVAAFTDGGPTGSKTDSFTTTSAGTYELVYGECCSAPAVLTVTTATATPEPTSIVLLATTLLGAGLMYKRRRNAV